MDFQATVNNVGAMACVVSIEKLDNGKYGTLRIVAGNQAYVDSIEKPAEGVHMLREKFIPNSEYTDYITRDLNFESACYDAAINRKVIHSYANPGRMDVWFNMTFLPMASDRDDLAYCMYIMEIDFVPDPRNFSSIPADTASTVLEACIKLKGTRDFLLSIQDVVEDIRDLCDAEHCCILLVDDYERSCSVAGEAFAYGSKLLPMAHYLDGFYDIALTWEDTLGGSDCIIIKNEQEMEVLRERNPVWHDSITGAGGQSIVLFPLKSQGKRIGYMWAINFVKEDADKIKETLELTTFILGSEIGNYLLIDRLKILSSKDMLTGVLNRNEMNNLVTSLCNGSNKTDKTVGVIFFDLNGLKAINDTRGHSEGDQFLRNAAKAIREVFDENDIFRAGGDEFTVIMLGITEDELSKKIEEVRKTSEKYEDLSLAIGGHVVDKAQDIRTALIKADERMFEDKKKYYDEHPEAVRRLR